MSEEGWPGAKSRQKVAPWSAAAAIFILFFACLFSPSGRALAGGRFQSSPEKIRRIGDLAAAYFDLGMLNGSFLVALDGQIIFEKGYGLANLEWDIPNSPDTVFNIASLSKQFTAAAVMMLAEEGKIGYDEPVSQYLPWLRRDLAERMTIRQLLTHTAGLPDEPICPVERMNHPLQTKDDLVAAINRMDLIFAPGTRFSYSNVGYNILALIVEAQSGMDFADFLRQKIFDRLGMSGTRWIGARCIIENRAQGYFSFLGRKEIEESELADIEMLGPGDIYSSVRDLWKWDRALANHVLLSEQATNLTFTTHKSDYGFGWELPSDFYINGVTQRLAMHTGRGPGASSIIMRFLDDGLLIVGLQNIQRSGIVNLGYGVTNILAGEPNGREPDPKPLVEDEVLRRLLSQGVDAAGAFYREAQKGGSYRMPGSGGLNRLAYQLLRSGRTAQALRVFELFQVLYPTQSIAYDGYAEALAIAGDKDSSIANYQKAIELNLNNVAALRALKTFGISDPTRLTSPLYREILDRGAEAGPKIFADLEKSGQAPGETVINAVAYNLFRNGRKSEALRLFEFNTLTFPQSWNAWDSYGEALQDTGKTELAIRSYRKSVELNPQNKTAIDKLRELEKTKDRS